jgi:hypothetical protein
LGFKAVTDGPRNHNRAAINPVSAENLFSVRIFTLNFYVPAHVE